MTNARLLVDLPERSWKGDVSRRHPGTTLRVHASVVNGEVGFELVTVAGSNVAECISTIETHSAVSDVSYLERSDGEGTIQIEGTAPPISLAAKESRFPVEYPLEIHDGRATVDATGSHSRLSALGEHLRDVGLRFEVAYIQHEHQTSQLLTEKQQQLLLAAVERGYYETPRRCTLTELAEHADVAKSTCSEMLHRVEETVVEYFVTNAPTVRHSERRQVTT